MTEERAKKVLQEQIDIILEYDEEDIEALEMAIKALERQEHCEEHVKSLIGKAKQNITVGKEDYNMGIYVGLIKALNLFENKAESEE